MLDLETIVERISEALMEHLDGDYVAKLANEILGTNIVYIGDSFFEENEECEK
jgi:hypothetical protein